MPKPDRKPIVLALTAIVILTTITACNAPAAPTPNLPATIAAEVETRLAAIPTATPYPTYTPVPTPEPPTATPNLPATMVRLIDDRLAAMPTITPIPTPDIIPTMEHAIAVRLSDILTPAPTPDLLPTIESAIETRLRDISTTEPVSPGWTTYQGSIIRRELNCPELYLSDWTIHLPNTLRLAPDSDCDAIMFFSEYEEKGILIGYEDGLEFGQTPDRAIQQISERAAHDYAIEEYTPLEEGEIKVTGVQETTHRGRKALFVNFTIQYSVFRISMECPMGVLFLPSKGWTSHNNQQIYTIGVINCTENRYELAPNRYELAPDLQHAIDSFTEILP